MTKKIDLVGQRFGRLVVVSEDGRDSQGKVLFKCLCDCGNYITTRAYSLRNGSCRSCGCRRKEVSSENNSTHGHSNEKLYGVWRGMIKRCYDPNHQAYERYGGRGITVCQEWLDNYEAFRDFMLVNGYDEYGLAYENTIDRIDNNKGYSPDNCRVATMRTQSLNKSSNHLITYKGKKMTVTEAAEKNNLTNHQVFNRLDKGWSMNRALHQPLGKVSTYTASNQTCTIAEWAQIMGVTDAVIRGRLRTHTMQEIYNEWREKGSLEVGDYSIKLEDANGEAHTRTKWAQVIGIDVTTLRKLLKEHTMQEIYDDWKTHDGRLSFIRCNTLEEANGEAHNRKEWCEILHISPKCLRNKLKKMSMQEIYDMYKDRIST
jgi:DNA-binding protein Fis